MAAYDYGNVLEAMAKGVKFDPFGNFAEGWGKGQENAALQQKMEQARQVRNALAKAGAEMGGTAGDLMVADPNAAVALQGLQLKQKQDQRQQDMVRELFGPTGWGGNAGAGAPASTGTPAPPGWSGSSSPDETSKLPDLYKKKARAEAIGADNVSQAIGAEIARINNADERSTRQQGIDIQRNAQDFQQAGGEKRVAYTQQLGQDRRTGSESLATLDKLEKFVDDPNFISGKWSSLPRDTLRFLTGLGITNAGQANEVFISMKAKLAKDELGSLGTGISNTDREFVEAQFPGLDFSRASNKEIIGIRKAIAQRKIDVGQQAAQYLKDTGKSYLDSNWEDHIGQWAESHPLFGTPANNPVNNASKDEAAKALGITREEYDRRANQSAREAPQQSGVPDWAVGALKAHPDQAKEFDKKFGPGTAARILSGG